MIISCDAYIVADYLQAVAHEGALQTCQDAASDVEGVTLW